MRSILYTHRFATRDDAEECAALELRRYPFEGYSTRTRVWFDEGDTERPFCCTIVRATSCD